jgi:hypothetical protein
MRDRAERVESLNKDAEAGVAARAAAMLPPSSAGALAPWRALIMKARASWSATSETARLLCAFSVAVALGGACGLWISVRIASATDAFAPSRPQLISDAPTDRRSVTGSQTLERSPAEHQDTSSAPDHAVTSNESGEEAAAEMSKSNPAGATDESRPGRRGAGGVADTPAPAEDEATKLDKTAEALGGVSVVKQGAQAARTQGGATPCAVYASQDALTLRAGGAAVLVLGGLGQQGRVTVTTPDWSNIAVLSEGTAGGGRGWMRYSVRSVSARAGAYALHVRTPCGSKTIPVTVRLP